MMKPKVSSIPGTLGSCSDHAPLTAKYSPTGKEGLNLPALCCGSTFFFFTRRCWGGIDSSASSAFAFLLCSDLILTSMPGFAGPSLESSSGPTRTGFCKETQIPRVHFKGRNSHPHSTSQGSPWPDLMTMCLQRVFEVLLGVSPCSHPLATWLMGLFPSPLIMRELSS